LRSRICTCRFEGLQHEESPFCRCPIPSRFLRKGGDFESGWRGRKVLVPPSQTLALRLRSGLRLALARLRLIQRPAASSYSGGRSWSQVSQKRRDPGHASAKQKCIDPSLGVRRKATDPLSQDDKGESYRAKSPPFRKSAKGWGTRAPQKIFTVSQKADSSPLKRIRNDKSRSEPEQGTSEAKAVQSRCPYRSAEALRHPNSKSPGFQEMRMDRVSGQEGHPPL